MGDSGPMPLRWPVGNGVGGTGWRRARGGELEDEEPDEDKCRLRCWALGQMNC